MGMNCAALCACLADTDSLDVTGYLLSVLWKLCELAHEYKPSHEQCVSLVKSREGLVVSVPLARQ